MYFDNQKMIQNEVVVIFIGQPFVIYKLDVLQTSTLDLFTDFGANNFYAPGLTCNAK